MVKSELKPFINELEIRLRTLQLAQQIADDYGGEEFVVISILKGAFMFTADLLRRLYDLGAKPETDFIRASSYGCGTKSKGAIDIVFDVSLSLEGKNILLVDDIVDSGRTLKHLADHLRNNRRAADVRTCVLLDKPSRREVTFVPDYVGFEIPDKFVVGYGIDYAERYRYLPFVSIVSEDDA